ncbi:nicotinate (nicotinamide) nucleotide adenylyltransferase [candidate division WOR-3 bacterium]|nr:nicotinate (nicotinamide) nucleotide adenylyltransferase [candidate division WOR-3 bacterium]
MRLGILGGSFDPIHVGHLLVAEDVRQKLRLDRVLFVPAFSPPHKAAPVAPYHHRLNMTRLAIRSLPGMELLPVEGSLPVPSYTVNTLKAVKEQFPAARRYFMMGSDQYRTMAHWHEPIELARLARLVVMSRPGAAFPARFAGHSSLRVVMLDVVPVAVSAAVVRQRLAKGRSVRYILPEAVLEYISRHRLYNNAAPRPVCRIRSTGPRQRKEK